MDVIPFESLVLARKQREQAKRERCRAREAAEMVEGRFVGPPLTQRDLDEHRAAVERLLAEHRAVARRDLGEFRAALRRDLAGLRHDLRRTARRLTVQIGALLAAAVGAVAAAQRLL